MDKIKAGRPAIDLIKLCCCSMRPLMLVGPHGLGKSELLEQAAMEMGIGVVCRDLSLMEPPDLVGLPKLEGETTKYLPPAFLPTEGDGLLALEELNRCERYMRAPCLQLFTARTLNDYRLPDGWLPVATMNPPDGANEVFEVDPPLLSRLVQVLLVPDRKEWLRWARRNRLHPAVRDYVSSDVSVFDTPESNPRAWKFVSDILWGCNVLEPTNKSLRAAVIGLVGDKRGSAFLSSLKQHERPLTSEDILASYSRHRPVLRNWIKTGKLDLVDVSLLQVEKHLQVRANYETVKSSSKRWRRLAMFLHDLQGDLRKKAEEFFRERDYTFPESPKGRARSG